MKKRLPAVLLTFFFPSMLLVLLLHLGTSSVAAGQTGCCSTFQATSLKRPSYTLPVLQSDNNTYTITARSESGKDIFFKTNNGSVNDPTTIEKWIPMLVLYRDGELTPSDERTIQLILEDVWLPANISATVAFTVSTQLRDPDQGAGQFAPYIPVWQEVRTFTPTTLLPDVSFTHEFTESIWYNGVLTDTPTDYFQVSVRVKPSDAPQKVSQSDYVFLMENQLTVPLPPVPEDEPGAAPDFMRIHYTDMFPYTVKSFDLNTWLPRSTISDFVALDLAPMLAEVFRLESDDWSMGPWYGDWKDYSELDDTLEIALNDGETWFHYRAQNSSRGNIFVMLNLCNKCSSDRWCQYLQGYDGVTGTAAGDLVEGIRGTFLHEFYHTLQHNIRHHFGVPHIDDLGYWGMFVEGQPTLATVVGQQAYQLIPLVPYRHRQYQIFANDFFMKGYLNKSLSAFDRKENRGYESVPYWRFLFEQCNGMANVADGMMVSRVAFEQYVRHFSRLVPPITLPLASTTDDRISSVMDAVFSDPRVEPICPFDTYTQSLTAFAHANYSLRLDNSEYFEPVQAGGRITVYVEPQAIIKTYDVAIGGEIEIADQITGSYGMDFVEVSLAGARRSPLTIDFQAKRPEELYDIQFIWLQPGVEHRRPAAYLTSPPGGNRLQINPAFPETSMRTFNGRLAKVVEIDTRGIPPLTLGLVIVRLDNYEEVLPITDNGAYTLTIGADLDRDQDGIPDFYEFVDDPLLDDADQDGSPNWLDPDSDGDHIPDWVEAWCRQAGDCSNVPDWTLLPDMDGDDIPDYRETDGVRDLDEDGLIDWIEIGCYLEDDCTNVTTWADVPDSDSVFHPDIDPDFYEQDSEHDGLPDWLEAGCASTDSCEEIWFPTGWVPNFIDSDSDEIPDYREVDSDDDNIPDWQEADCLAEHDCSNYGDLWADIPDTDNDSLYDFRDYDSDDDEIPDKVERLCTEDPENPGLPVGTGSLSPVELGNACDSDNRDGAGDNVPDYRDSDSDDDAVLDLVEAGPDPANPIDGDKNGIPAFRDPGEAYITPPSNDDIMGCQPFWGFPWSFEQGINCGVELIRNTLLKAGIEVEDPPVPAMLFDTTPSVQSGESAQVNVFAAATHSTEPLTATLATSYTLLSGDIQASWSTNAWVGSQFTNLSLPWAQVYDQNDTLIASGSVEATPLHAGQTAVALALGDTLQYSLQGTGSSSFYAPATEGMGVGGRWLTYTAQIQAPTAYGVGLQGAALTVNGSPLNAEGTLVLVTTGTLTLSGEGRTLAPNFGGAVSLQANHAELIIGPATLLEGQAPVSELSSPLSFANYSGAITITQQTADLDRVELVGLATRDLSLLADPAASTITPAESASFQALIRSNQDDVYELTAVPPGGWTAQVDASGRITVTPALDAIPGDYPVRLLAQSTTEELWATAVHQVTVTPWQGMALSVAQDPLTTVPMGPPTAIGNPSGINNGQAQVPGAAYIATITNSSSSGHVFDVVVVPDDFPAEWIMLGGAGRATTTTVALPAGGVGQLGVYISPIGLESLPAAGTELPFTVHATAVEAPSLNRSAPATFVMPYIPFAHVLAAPPLVYSTPGGEAEIEVSLTNVGNTADPFSLQTELPHDEWGIVQGWITPTLWPGEQSVQTLHIATPAGELGRDYRVEVGTQCGVYRPSAAVKVRLISPNALAIYRATLRLNTCQGEDQILPLVTDFLVTTVDDADASCQNGTQNLPEGERNRLASAILALANETASYPLITADEDLLDLGQALQGHDSCVELSADVEALSTAVEALQNQTCAVAEHMVSLSLYPGSDYTLVDRPLTYTLSLLNQGTLTTTYTADLQIDGATNPHLAALPSPFTVTLGSGEIMTTLIVLIPTLTGQDMLQAEVVAQEAPLVQAQATAALRSLDAYLDILEVGAVPAFIEFGSGQEAALYTRIANLTNASITGTARTRLWDAAGTPVYTDTRHLDFDSALVPMQHSLGTLDSSGLVTGFYTITLEILDTEGEIIPYAASASPLLAGTGRGAWGNLGVGQAILAYSSVDSQVVAPGDPTVTVLIHTEMSPSLLELYTAAMGPHTAAQLAALQLNQDQLSMAPVCLLANLQQQASDALPAGLPEPLLDDGSQSRTDETQGVTYTPAEVQPVSYSPADSRQGTSGSAGGLPTAAEITPHMWTLLQPLEGHSNLEPSSSGLDLAMQPRYVSWNSFYLLAPLSTDQWAMAGDIQVNACPLLVGPSPNRGLNRYYSRRFAPQLQAEGPVAAFVVDYDRPNAPALVSFTDQSTPVGSIAAWHWDFGDGDFGSGPDPSHIYLESGEYTVTLTVTDTAGLTDTAAVPIEVSPNDLEFGADPVAGSAPLDVDFHLMSDAAYLDRVEWDFGDGASSDQYEPTHRFEEAGAFTVTLTAWYFDLSEPYTFVCSDCVEVYEELLVNFTAVPTVGVAPLTVVFSNTTTPAGMVDYYEWEFGDDSGLENGRHASHVYDTAGGYLAELRAYPYDGEPSVFFTNIEVVELLADFEVDRQLGPAPMTVHFADRSAYAYGAIDDWLWDFGDGISSTLSAPTHTYSVPGVYTVSLTVRAEGLEDTRIEPSYLTVEDYTIYDPFDEAQLDPSWDWYTPYGNPQFSLTENPGQFRLMLPSTERYDHWVDVNRAPQLLNWELAEAYLAGDWTIETKLKLVEFVSDDAFHTGLTVRFAPTDQFYWGPYRGTDIKLERSGMTDLVIVGNDSQVVSLRVRKEGTNYYFEYRLEGSGTEWQFAKVETAPQTPLAVGLIAKTWDYVPLTVDFDYFGFQGDIYLDFDASPTMGQAPLAVVFSSPVTAWDSTESWLWDFGDCDNFPECDSSSQLANPTHIYQAAGVYTVSLTVTDTDGLSYEIQKPAFIKASPLTPLNLEPRPNFDWADQFGLAFNADADEYLLTWREWSSDRHQIYAKRLGPDGDPLGEVLTISGPTGNQRDPVVAYAGGLGQYLIVWIDRQAGETQNLYGRIVASDGQPLSDIFSIRISDSLTKDPDVIFSPVTQEYLLTWAENVPDHAHNVLAQRISTGGSLEGDVIAIDGRGGQNLEPALAVGDDGNYLFTWMRGNGHGYDIWARLVSTDTATLHEFVQVETTPRSFYRPAVAFDSANDEFLIVWDAGVEGSGIIEKSVMARRLSQTGVLIGETFVVGEPWTTNSGGEYQPVVGYDAVTGQMLVVWGQSGENGYDIRGRLLGPNNELQAGWYPFTVHSANQWSPNLTSADASGQFLVIWMDGRNGGGDIFGATFRPIRADFGADTTIDLMPLEVTFHDESVPAGAVDSWLWSFGDGVTSTVQNPSHTYENPGGFTVALQIQGDRQRSSQVRTEYITVLDDYLDLDASLIDTWPDAGVIADGFHTSTLTVTLITAKGSLLAGRAVTVSLLSGSDCFIDGRPAAVGEGFYLGLSNDDGVVSTTLSSTLAESKVIEARVPDGPLSMTATVRFVAGPITHTNSTVLVYPEEALANGVDTVTVTAVLRDQHHNPAVMRNVELWVYSSEQDKESLEATLVTDMDGQLEYQLVWPVPDQLNILFRDIEFDRMVQTDAAVDFVDGPISLANSTILITPSAAIANGLHSIVITGHLVSELGHLAGDRIIALYAGDTELESIWTEQDGSFHFELAPRIVVESLDLSLFDVFYDTMIPIGQANFVPGPLDIDASQLESDLEVLLANGLESASLVATLYDSYDHPLPGRQVEIRSSGNVTLTQIISTTDEQGRVQAAIRSAEVQTVTVTAYDMGDGVTLAQERILSFIPGPIDQAHSSVTISPTTVVADGFTPAAIEAQLFDAWEHPVARRAVTLLVDGQGYTIAPAAEQTTDENGWVYFDLTSTQVATAQLSLRDELFVTATISAGQVLFVPGSPDLGASQVSVSPTDLPADGAPATITVDVFDAYQHPVPGVTVTLALDQAYAQLDQPATGTNAEGRITGTVSSLRAGSVEVSASINGVPITDTATISFHGPDLSVSKTAPDQAVAGDLISYTISIENEGPALAAGVSLTDTLPAEMVFVGQAGPGFFTQNDQILTWSLGDLAPGAQAQVQIQALVDQNVPLGSTVNEATASTITFEENLANNTHNVATTIIGADLRVQSNGSEFGSAGYPVTYTINVSNLGPAAAVGIVLTDTLPEHVAFFTQTSPYSYTLIGHDIVWQLGNLDPEQSSVELEITGLMKGSAPLDGYLLNQAWVSSETTDENPTNDTDLVSTQVRPGYGLEIQLEPNHASATLGKAVTYRLQVHNTGTLADQYALSIGEFNDGWYTIEPATLDLPAGGMGEVELTFFVNISDCQASGSYFFDILVSSVNSSVQDESRGWLTLQPNPIIENVTPSNDTRLGSRDALFAWTTDITATTSLFIRESGTPTFTEHIANPDTDHRVQLPLNWDTEYDWYVRSESVCGVSQTTSRDLAVVYGVGFTEPDYYFEIQRDYDQRVKLTVKNNDIISHTLLLTMTTPNDELIVGFVGSGSMDQEITLGSGEERDVVLALHAQDAVPNAIYELVAHLLADEGGDPIADFAPIRVKVFVEDVDFAVDEIGHNPETLVRTFRITNHSNFALTDLAVDYQVISGAGAIYVSPSMSHARLDVGQSRQFKIIPMLTEDFVGATVQIIVSAAGEERVVTRDIACQEGCEPYLGRAENVMMEARTGDWYCTNRPYITTRIDLPSGVSRANMLSAELRLSLTPRGGVRPHDVDIYVNGHHVGGIYDTVPHGVYVFQVEPEMLNEAANEISRNVITLRTRHMNGGHYIVGANMTLSACLSEYNEWVCASDQAGANDIVLNRSYLIPAAETITVQIVEPQDDAQFLVGSEIQVSARITDSLLGNRLYAVIGAADNNNGGLMLFDDGYHGDGNSGDGLYGNIWAPFTLGSTALTVRAGNCQISGTDSISVVIRKAEAQLELSHHSPLSGVVTLTDTFSHIPDSIIADAGQETVNWTFSLTSTQSARDTSFSLQLPAMKPGETRQVASGTVVSYTTIAGHGLLNLPPLYVSAAHLVAVDPPRRVTGPASLVEFTAWLNNPLSASEQYTLSIDGLPSSWAPEPMMISLEARQELAVPITISVPAEAALADYPFAATVHTSSGGRDAAQAELVVQDLLEISITPFLQSAKNAQTVSYTLTISNLENVDRSYALSAEGLANNDVNLPPEVNVAAMSTSTFTLQLTAWAPKGLYPFTVAASYEGPDRFASAAAEAVLVVLDELGVDVALDPTAAPAGRGSPAVFALVVTNTGSLVDIYDLAVDLPAGWTGEISANNRPLDEIELTPYVFNAAPLQLVVVPPVDEEPGVSYPITVRATSQTDVDIEATVISQIDVSFRGVTVQIDPQSSTMDPTASQTWNVTVQNNSTGMDTFDLTPGGIISGSAQFNVNPVTLAAGESAVVQLQAGPLEFALPQTLPLAVTAQSQYDPAIIGYDTAEVTIQGFEDVDIQVLPPGLRVTNTMEATFLLVITNTGNIDTVYHLAHSSGSVLDLELELSEIYLPPHMAAGILIQAVADSAGTHDFTVQADSAGGLATGTAIGELTVISVNRPPVVNAGLDRAVEEGAVASFDGSYVDPDLGDEHTIEWDFGDGTSAQGALQPNHIFADDGVYVVTLIVTDGDGQTGSDTLLLTVSNVAPSVEVGPNQAAEEGNTVAFDGAFTDPGTLDTHTVQWDLGDGTLMYDVLNPTHEFLNNNVYTVTLTVTDDDGGIGVDTLRVNVGNVTPVVDAGPDQFVAEGDTVHLNGSFTDAGTLDTHTIEWDLGDGTAASGNLAPSHIYQDDGVYTATLSITDDAGDTGQDTLLVTVNNVAPTSAAGPDQIADEGDILSFVGSFTDSGLADTHTIHWDFGDGGVTAGTLNPNHVFEDNGVYTVTLTVTDDDGGSGSDSLLATIVNVAPTVEAGPDQTVDAGQVVDFTGSFADPGVADIHTIHWDLGDGATAEGALAPSHTYVSEGSYTAVLTITDDDGGVGTSSMQVNVGNVTLSVEAGPDQLAAEGEVISFNGSFTDVGIDTPTIVWNFGDGVTAYDTLTPTHSYLDDGVYTVTLTITDSDGVTGSDALAVTVNNVAPMVDAGADQSSVEGELVTFNGAFADAGILDIHSTEWDFGDGTVVSDMLTPTHTYVEDGIYTVTLTVTDDDGGSDGDTLLVSTANAAPLVDAGPDQTAVEGQELSFAGAYSDPGVLDSHTILWDFGDGETASDTLTPTHIFVDDGTYTVILTVEDDDGGVSSDILLVQVGNAVPVVDAGPDQTADEGQLVQFAGLFSDVGALDTHLIEWNLGDGTTITGDLTPTYAFVNEGVYTVTLSVADNAGGVGTDTAVVMVNNVAPSVYAGPDQTANEGNMVTFEGAFDDPGILDAHSILWDFGDGITAGGSLTASHIYADNAVYTVTLTIADDGGGISTDAVLVTVANVSPIVDAGQDKTVAEGSIVSFSGAFTDMGSLDVHSSEWDLGDGTLITGTLNPTHTYADDGVYTVILTVTDDDGGTGSDTLLITVDNVEPAVEAGPDLTLNEGESTSLAGSFTDPGLFDNHTIEWNFGDGTATSDILNPIHSFTDNGVYSVTLTVSDDDGGVGADTLLVTVANLEPTVDAGTDQEVDEGDIVSFLGSFTDPGTLDTVTIQWDFGDGATSSGALASIQTYDDNGSYTVTLTVTDNDGGVGMDTLIVAVNNVAPTADLTNLSGPVDEGEMLTLTFSEQLDPSQADSEAGFVYSYDCNGDGTFELSSSSSASFDCLYLDDGVFSATGRIADKDDGLSDYTVEVLVYNAAPVVGEIMATIHPVEVGIATAATASFTDTGVLDTHTAVWDWGDGTTSSGQVSESNGSGTVVGSHLYSIPGVYTVMLTVTDDDGGVGTAVFKFVVVYDSNAGHVTGGGHFQSPAGAYPADPSLSGKANFGFVSKYKKGATTPTGQVQFQFKGGLNFHLTSYDWLVVSGARAQFAGTGTVNGEGEYKFMIIAIDGQIDGSGTDRFRIKIWWEEPDGTQHVVYDNQLGEPDDGDAATELEGGSIVIHK